jgi:hypothetical protein
MSTAAQAAANIANAQHSTGPRTEQGKQTSSHNALKHGLTASTVLIPGEDPAAYEHFKNELTAFWAPEGAGEIAFVEELISLQWRLRRCERLEADVLAASVPDFKALSTLSLHGGRLKRQYSATLKELTEMQKLRFVQAQESLRDAVLIRRADIVTGCATDFSQFGFVFTTDQIDRYIHRQDTVQAAATVLGVDLLRCAA